jgi:streptogramin lyase
VLVASYYGIYGGAVDGDDHFWGSQLGLGHIARVDFVDYHVETFPMAVSGYGMAVDKNGHVWTCSYEVGRFDYATASWQTNTVMGSGGCMPDGNDLIWLASDPMVGVDINTLQVVKTLDVPNYVHGVSIDFDGYVWGPAIYNNEAYRVDPNSGQVDIVTGLNYPYTYSDMTGFGLSQAGAPSG